jgi:NAD(P)-dependent dehydrogenase (short-subunit alcohol dehydrogenase family)
MKLNNKLAIVTGAANGIGLSICQNFLKEGAIVIATDIDEATCKAEVERMQGSGKRVFAYACDVGNTNDVNRLIDLVQEEFKQIDILVNNAAVAIGGNIISMPEEDWDRLMNINLKSIYRTVKAVLPTMINQHSGSVINISSTQAFRSWKNWTAYAAAKGAMLSMTRQLAGQFGENNVRFNTISPGAILTPMNARRAEAEGPEFVKQSEQMHALRRMGKPEEVAATAVFLASDESAFITGADLTVDGGLSTLPRYWE